MARLTLPIVFFTLLGLSCSDSVESSLDESNSSCGDGTFETIEGATFCVFDSAQQICPESHTKRFESADVVVCGQSDSDDLSPEEDEKLSEKYGSPTCVDPWREFEIEGVTYCVLQPAGDSEHICPAGQPIRLSNEWHDLIVCVDDESAEIERVREELAKDCENASDSSEACNATLGCRFIESTHHARVEDGMCVQEAGAVCLYVMGELGNAPDCSYRTVDGVGEAIWTNSIFESVGWENGGDTASADSPCRCIKGN